MKNSFEYKGISFSEGTPLVLCDKLIHLNKTRERVTLDLGDIKTNESWGESCDVNGYVGKSTGIVPIFILVYNSRSSGGGAILTDRILSIKASKGKRLLYQNKLV